MVESARQKVEAAALNPRNAPARGAPYVVAVAEADPRPKAHQQDEGPPIPCVSTKSSPKRAFMRWAVLGSNQ
jgi:hypothetical protein